MPGRQRVAGALRRLRLDVESSPDVGRSRSRVASTCASSVPSSVSICCAGEPGRVVAFERERPGGEDAGAFAGGVRDRGRIAAGGGELLADALQLHRAAVPHQRALLELGLALRR